MFVVATVSILGITGVAALIRAKTPLRICPICAGVSGTWGWMLAAQWAGYAVDSLILGILMGGSVVGAAYQLEKRLPSGRSLLLFKTVFITVGMLAVYELIQARLPSFFASLGALLIFTLVILRPRRGHGKKEGERIQALEEKMKHCC